MIPTEIRHFHLFGGLGGGDLGADAYGLGALRGVRQESPILNLLVDINQ